jgi:sensor histidine kinase YesM
MARFPAINSPIDPYLWIRKLRIVWHLLFWCAGFIVLFLLFRTSRGVAPIDLIYTAFFLLPISATVYINLYVLIPRLLKQERFLLFLLSEAVIIVLAALMIYLLFDRWIDLFLKKYYFIAYDKVSTLVIYTASFIVLSTLLKLSSEWVGLIHAERQKNLDQFRNLQSQINPHFLLNSLQTIYSQSLNRSDETPSTVLKLSEILKFSLYETEDNRVRLERELEVVQDYVEMYRLRLEPSRARIDLTIEGDPGDRMIAPLLFLPFIENSIKHGIQASGEKAFSEITFRIVPGRVHFSIINSTGHTDAPDRKKYSGIGIRNTRKRLELLYPGKHKLTIENTDNSFIVYLDIEI